MKGHHFSTPASVLALLALFALVGGSFILSSTREQSLQDVGPGSEAALVDAPGLNELVPTDELQMDGAHNPPLLLAEGEPLELRYLIVCPPLGGKPGKGCGGSGSVLVRTDGSDRYVRFPLIRGGEARDRLWYVQVPDALTQNRGAYYAVLQDVGHQLQMTLPLNADVGPQKFWRLPPTTAILALPLQESTRERPPSELIASGSWGDGDGQFGLDDGPEQGRIGPTGFDVSSDGRLVIFDHVNDRLISFTPGHHAPLSTRLERKSGWADVRIAPTGEVLLLEKPREALVPEIRVISRGTLALKASAADRRADVIGLSSSGVWVHEYPSELWRRILTIGPSGIELPSVTKGQTQPGRPIDANSELVLKVTEDEIRVALIDRESPIEAWRVRRPEDVRFAEVQLAELVGEDLLLVVKVWSQTEEAFRIIKVTPGGDLALDFSAPSGLWAEGTPLGRFRFAGESLYQLRTWDWGAEVARFDIAH